MTIFWSLPLVEHADFVLTGKKVLSTQKKKKKKKKEEKDINIEIIGQNNRFINLLLFVFMPSKYRLDAHCCLRSSSKKVKILQRKYFWENLERIGEFVGDNS